MDSGCVKGVGRFFVSLCLSSLAHNSNSKGEENVVEAVHVYLSSMKSSRLKHLLDSRVVPRRLYSVQTCQDMCCRICARCFRITRSSINHGISGILADLRCDEGD